MSGPAHEDDNVTFTGVHMDKTPANSRWDVCCKNGLISSISESSTSSQTSGSQFLSPSLCHPHIHLDKCFLLSHPKYADLEIQTGDFAEALRLTTAAKSRFESEDLLERGRALIEESIGFGVTHMRAFVEVDPGVELKCLRAGLDLKAEFRDRCYVQICVFAQDPIVSNDDKGEAMKALLESAVVMDGVEAIGSTPYVETESPHFETRWQAQEYNIHYMMWLALKHKLHLDFHIDYNLDPAEPKMVERVLESLHDLRWESNPSSADFRTVVLGHCTRQTLLDRDEMDDLSRLSRGLPVSFVGLPTSDLFMMGRPTAGSAGGERPRGTLQVPQLIQEYGLNAAIGINNVGNAFTPYGSCDPLALASFGVGIYQAGTKKDADLLLECVSTRAKKAIGIPSGSLTEGNPGDFVVFGSSTVGQRSFRTRRTTQDIISDPPHERKTIFNGNRVNT